MSFNNPMLLLLALTTDHANTMLYNQIAPLVVFMFTKFNVQYVYEND